MEKLYEKSRASNSTLPNTLEKSITDTSEGSGERQFIVKGRIKWQAALADGMSEARAKEWHRTASTGDRERVKEMAGEWILEEPPWWTRFQRAPWLIALRLRYGLEVNPAIWKNLSKRCLAKKCKDHIASNRLMHTANARKFVM